MIDNIKYVLHKLKDELKFNFIEDDIDIYCEKIYKNAKILTINESNELAGFIAFYDNDEKKNTAYLTMLAVNPKFNNNGYGRQLLSFSINLLKKKGFEFYDLELDRDNEIAMSLYESFGFKKIEVIGKIKMRLKL